MDKIDSLRLEYRRLCDTDWPLFLALHDDRQVMNFISDPLDEETIRRHYFEPRLRSWQPGCKHWLCLVISEKTTGIPIGVTGFIERSDSIAEVGFILKPEFQGKGYGSESLKDIIQFALTHYQYHKLVATVTSGNEASRRTLASAGFLQEGILRKNYYLKGSWQDDWLFGLLREETGY
ncbi:GCN5 family acetyltransferase [bacteria symbiont BFo2 of Frankliniella occidentalis]|nr:GCN5 family acetyltransferase [bacteria symbiont BFo2 of Frankliniella occidentalis]KYP96282.1 GCN5 family acetyltransferase [bacteria symbiont BFo2 of Frankliniella occidentalis]